MNIRTALASLAVLALSACGGGGGGDRDTTLAQVGVYQGAFTEEGQTFGIVGIVLENEKGYFFSPAATGIVVATLETDGTMLDGAFDSYEGFDGSEGSLVAERLASGSVMGVVTETAFTASFNSSLGTSGTLNMNQSAANDIPGGLLSVAGTWGLTDSSGTTTVVIGNNGSLIGSDDDGCQYTGQITSSASGANANALQLSVSCPGEGSVALNGAIARGLPSDGINTLVLVVANNDLALAAALFEQ